MLDLEKAAISCGLFWPVFEVDSTEWRLLETEPLGSFAVQSEGMMVPGPTVKNVGKVFHIDTYGLVHTRLLSRRDGQQTGTAQCTAGYGWGGGHSSCVNHSCEESRGGCVRGHKPT